MKPNDLARGFAPECGNTDQGLWWRRPRLVRATLLVLVLLGLATMWYSGILDRRIDEFLDSSGDSLPKDGRPAFVVTKYANWDIPQNAPLRQRLFMAYMRFHEKWGKKNPAAYKFGPSPVQLCSVHGLLNQCMQVTGTRYLIAREAAGRAVYFGNTNTLSGAQWVAAFEQALRDDGLLLLSNKTGVVKVIPGNKLQEYRKAGLVKGNE